MKHGVALRYAAVFAEVFQQLDVSSNDVQALLAHWRDSQQDLYVVFYKDKQTESLTGRVTTLADDAVIVGDAASQVRIPIREAMKASITMREHRVGSITITWADGASAFLMVR